MTGAPALSMAWLGLGWYTAAKRPVDRCSRGEIHVCREKHGRMRVLGSGGAGRDNGLCAKMKRASRRERACGRA